MTPKINDLRSRIGDAKAKLRRLEAELADAEREYGEAEIEKAGIVMNETRVQYHTDTCVVSGFKGLWGSGVRVWLSKIKKDGTPSRAPSGSAHLRELTILGDNA